MSNIQDKILKVFYEFPSKAFTIREISNLTKIPRATAHKHLLSLKKQKLITKDNRAGENLLFKNKKTNFFIEKIISSGLLGFLVIELNPSCIILFGSIRKGESVDESDIDLFVESPVKKNLNLNLFEKRIGHKIQLFIEPKIDKLQDNLFNNILNGIKLYGSFKIK